MEQAYCGPAPTPQTLAAAWNADPVALGLCVALAIIGWRGAAHARLPLAAALAMIVVLFVSPLCALTVALFSARAVHHVLLVAVVAPLLAIAFPTALRRMPPLGALVAIHAVTLWAWHWPPLYVEAIHSPVLYWVMQGSLLGTGYLLWQAILREGARGPALLALLATIVQMGMLGALLTFAREPLYAPHVFTTQAFGLAPLQDQQLAGLVMWVPAAVPYLYAALRIVADWLANPRQAERHAA